MSDFVPGLEGVVAFETQIAEPDKEGSSLRYRGVDIEDLVGKVGFAPQFLRGGVRLHPAQVAVVDFARHLRHRHAEGVGSIEGRQEQDRAGQEVRAGLDEETEHRGWTYPRLLLREGKGGPQLISSRRGDTGRLTGARWTHGGAGLPGQRVAMRQSAKVPKG